MNIDVYLTEKLSIFNILYFPLPGNEQMLNVIFLYSEILLIGVAVLYIIVEVLITLYIKFIFSENRAPFHFSPEMESFLDIFFLLLPTVLVILMLVPTLGYLYSTEDNIDRSSVAFTIFITGHQWYWSYAYNILDVVSYFNRYDLESYIPVGYTTHVGEHQFDSILVDSNVNRLLTVDNILLIPINSKISLAITSEDVIHSFAVPRLNIKTDAIPGKVATIILETPLADTWYGQCSELCGELHAFMPIVVCSVNTNTFFISIFINEEFVMAEEEVELEWDITEGEKNKDNKTNGLDITKEDPKVEADDQNKNIELENKEHLNENLK